MLRASYLHVAAFQADMPPQRQDAHDVPRLAAGKVMRQSRLNGLAAYLIVAVLSATASAQSPPFATPAKPELGRPEWGTPGPMLSNAPGAQMPNADPFQLLMNSPEVQADLGLTQGQLHQLQRAARNFHGAMQEMSYPRPGEPPELMRERMERNATETRGMIARELTGPQLQRLQQIMLQLEGPCLVTRDPELAQRLGLALDRLRTIREACHARAEEMSAGFRPPPASAGFCQAVIDNRDRIETIRAGSDRRILSLLSPRERSSFEQAAGQKLAIQPPMPPECR
jgi:hypothetical protein